MTRVNILRFLALIGEPTAAIQEDILAALGAGEFAAGSRYASPFVLHYCVARAWAQAALPGRAAVAALLVPRIVETIGEDPLGTALALNALIDLEYWGPETIGAGQRLLDTRAAARRLGLRPHCSKRRRRAGLHRRPGDGRARALGRREIDVMAAPGSTHDLNQQLHDLERTARAAGERFMATHGEGVELYRREISDGIAAAGERLRADVAEITANNALCTTLTQQLCDYVEWLQWSLWDLPYLAVPIGIDPDTFRQRVAGCGYVYLAGRVLDDALDRHFTYKSKYSTLFAITVEQTPTAQGADSLAILSGLLLLADGLCRLSQAGGEEMVAVLQRVLQSFRRAVLGAMMEHTARGLERRVLRAARLPEERRFLAHVSIAPYDTQATLAPLSVPGALLRAGPEVQRRARFSGNSNAEASPTCSPSPWRRKRRRLGNSRRQRSAPGRMCRGTSSSNSPRRCWSLEAERVDARPPSSRSRY